MVNIDRFSNSRRCVGEPLQHVTGDQGFRRIVVRVRPGVFVPRPETEILVGAAMDELASVADPLVVDVATGTGAVAVAIKDELPGATMFATDLSPEATASEPMSGVGSAAAV